MLITILVVSFLVRVGWSSVRVEDSSLQPGHYSRLIETNLQHTKNQERKDQYGNQHYSRELLMMVIVMPETCQAYKKYNKITSDI